MNTPREMMNPMLLATPTFSPVWNEFVEEWKEEKTGLPIYLLLSDLARHISELYKKGNMPELQAVFEIVERWHIEGNAYIREAATIGLLEDLQNTNVVGVGMPANFIKFLGPESARWWNKVEAFWENGTLITNE